MVPSKTKVYVICIKCNRFKFTRIYVYRVSHEGINILRNVKLIKIELKFKITYTYPTHYNTGLTCTGAEQMRAAGSLSIVNVFMRATRQT